MDAIKGYVMCALIASAVAGILKHLSSSMKGFEKYVGLVCSLVVVLLLSFPMVNIISEIKEAISESTPAPPDKESDEDDQIKGEQTMALYYIENVESTVKDLISERFSLNKDDFDVSAVLDKEYAVKNIVISIYTDTDTRAIKDFAQNTLCIKTEIRSIKEDEK